MTRLHNFNAGPATLPLDVLQQAQRDLVCYPQAGMSVMEMSHRSSNFDTILNQTRTLITELYAIPDTHEILFLQGGASLQFAMIPLNFSGHGAYVNTGTWSTRALAEAQTIGQADEVWSSESSGFTHIPSNTIHLQDHHTYLHFTSNNTIYGTQYPTLPILSHSIPLIADVSSDLLSKPLDLSRFDLIYGGAQKNAGPSGITLLIIRKTLSRSPALTAKCPKILQYQTHAQKESMYNTPNTFGIYLLGLMAQWMHDRGGLDQIERAHQKQAQLIYDLIDQSPDIYQGHAEVQSRSLMNITFRLTDPARQDEFLTQAQDRGLIGLKGHRSVGGLRASLYNALSDESVEALASFLSSFAQQRRHQ
jgi:phosphoserine aminotransferase